MKRVLLLSLCMLVLIGLVGCIEKSYTKNDGHTPDWEK